MKHENLSRLEAAVRAANPVPQPVDLVDSEESSAVATLVQDGRHTVVSTSTQAPQPTLRLKQSRRSWVWAIATALVILTGVGIAVQVMGGGNRSNESAAPVTADIERPIIEVTFDGETCSVSGPTSVGGAFYWFGDIVGEGQAFVLTDTSGLGARLVIAGPLGGTYDDLVEALEPGSYIGEENTISFAPEHRPTIELADIQSMRVLLLSSGPKAILVEADHGIDRQLWLCGPLEVTY